MLFGYLSAFPFPGNLNTTQDIYCSKDFNESFTNPENPEKSRSQTTGKSLSPKIHFNIAEDTVEECIEQIIRHLTKTDVFKKI